MGNEPAQGDFFHFDDDRPSFEDLSHDNGFHFWWARDLMEVLGYETWGAFKNVVNKAMNACATLNIAISDNFKEDKRSVGGVERVDIRLTRFACYLTAVNGDPKKPKVAAAQAYFVTFAEAFRQYVQDAENVERVLVRGEISEREKSLQGVAAAHGVQNYAFFQDQGYRGLYNMGIKQLRIRKGIDTKRSPLDFMGKTELAANLFRITQTEEVVRSRNVRGQYQLEQTAHSVGRQVRKTMQEISGINPEDLPAHGDIRQVKSDIKRTQREFAKVDKKKLPKKP